MSGSIGTHHAAAAGAATLPFTGSEFMFLAAAGFTLLMAGAAMLRLLPRLQRDG